MPVFWNTPTTRATVTTEPATLRYIVLFLVAVALAFYAGYTCPREVVCDNVSFHEFEVPYAVQASCNEGFTVTLLD